MQYGPHDKPIEYGSPESRFRLKKNMRDFLSYTLDHSFKTYHNIIEEIDRLLEKGDEVTTFNDLTIVLSLIIDSYLLGTNENPGLEMITNMELKCLIKKLIAKNDYPKALAAALYTHRHRVTTDGRSVTLSITYMRDSVRNYLSKGDAHALSIEEKTFLWQLLLRLNYIVGDEES